jgi:membrane protease YdiL (CAAX protease family)
MKESSVAPFHLAADWLWSYFQIVETASKFFRSHLWLAFLAHQGLILALALLFLSSVRRLTGRTIHAGRDPIGLLDGLVLVALSIAVILFTQLLYRWLKGKDASPLGLTLSPRRCIELFIGILLGFALAILPWVIALSNGTAQVIDRISTYFDASAIVRMTSLAFFLLLLQSVMEETANRAFPIRLWEHRSLAFRVLIPSFFFAAIHLADEQFSFERIGILIVGGVIQSFAYLLTGNVWFTSGVHAGANVATFSVSGLWHAGAIVSVVGQPAFPNWVAVMLMLGAMILAYFCSRRPWSRGACRQCAGGSS